MITIDIRHSNEQGRGIDKNDGLGRITNKNDVQGSPDRQVLHRINLGKQ